MPLITQSFQLNLKQEARNHSHKTSPPTLLSLWVKVEYNRVFVYYYFPIRVS